MVCILSILWILILSRASKGLNWEVGKLNSGNENTEAFRNNHLDTSSGEIEDIFKMNNHKKPLSNPERYFGIEFNPGNTKVEVRINNQYDVTSKNCQKFYHMNNHGRPLSNPEKYFGRSKRNIIRSIGQHERKPKS